MKKYLLIAALTAALFAGCTGVSHDKVDLFNLSASVFNPDSLGVNPLGWQVITLMIDKRGHTMSTLYANPDAFQYASTHSDGRYPEDAELALVTWQQKADKHWFGADIPGRISSVELVTFVRISSGEAEPQYRRYGGDPLTREKNADEATRTRTAFITRQRMVMIPQ